MRSLRLAFSFIRVPKLFGTLLFWPLRAGVGVGVFQVVGTATYIRLADEDFDQFQQRIEKPDHSVTMIRSHLYGGPQELGPLQVCRWVPDGAGERPPSEDCRIEPLDVSVRSASPDTFDAQPFVHFFQGATRRLHICRGCTSEILISETADGRRSDVYSLGGLGVYMLIESAYDKEIQRDVLAARSTIEKLKDFAGTILLHPPGAKNPVNISRASTVMVLVLNTAFLIIITLWLSLVGHRKVLQYFARNDALLPLVAACGKAEFYNSLWVITLLRVSLFLFATLPATVLIYVHAIPEETLGEFMGSGVHFLLWISAIISSLSTMTIIASIAELKQRHSMLSFIYKYVPILCFFVGTCTWVYTLFFAGRVLTALQSFVSVLPLLGLSPIVLAPVFKIDPTILALHTVFASLLVVILLRLNSRWFAAHLEEI